MTSDQPLSGIRVLDISSLYAGPWIATTLGDFGADVLKVEHPRGDDARRWGPSKDGVPLWWKVISRNKRLLTLDLHEEEDRDVVRRLAEQADIVVENFRPGRLQAWGLGYETLREVNPGLIMVHVTGFGQTGPRSNEPGFGTLAEAFSGFAYMTGQADGPPTLPPFGLADGVASTVGTSACLMALYWRDARGGTGQEIDLSLFEPLFSILGPQVIEYTQLGEIQQRRGNRSGRTSPRNAYETADGRWVALSGGTQQVVNRMLAVIGRPELAEDPRFSTPLARRENADELDQLMADWIGSQPLGKVLADFSEAQAPIAPVYDIAQIVADPHYNARQTIIQVDDDDLGEISMQNVVPRLSETPGRVRHTGRTAIGADMEAIRDWLGTDAEVPSPRPADSSEDQGAPGI